VPGKKLDGPVRTGPSEKLEGPVMPGPSMSDVRSATVSDSRSRIREA